MYETTYARATTVDDAVGMMGKAEDAKFLSGGHTLLPTMKQRLAAPSAPDRPYAHRRSVGHRGERQECKNRRDDDP